MANYFNAPRRQPTEEAKVYFYAIVPFGEEPDQETLNLESARPMSITSRLSN